MNFPKRGRVGDNTGTYIGLGVAVAVVIGGYLLWQKFFGPSTASQATAANNASLQQANQAATTATQQAVAATGQTPSLSAAAIQGLVNTIVTNLTVTDPSNYPLGPPSTSSISNMLGIATDYTPNATAISNAVTQCNNTADWAALQAAFGTKQLLNGQSVSLVAALQLALPTSVISNIDSYFADQGIMDGTGTRIATLTT